MTARGDGTTLLLNREEFSGAMVRRFKRFFAKERYRRDGYVAFNDALKKRIETHAEQ